MKVMPMREAERLSFAQAVVETRGMEKKLIHMETLNAVLAKQDLAKLEAALQAGGYHWIEKGVLRRDNYDDLLRLEMESFAAEVVALSPDKAVMDVLFLEYDLYNIKALLLRYDPMVFFDSHLIRIPPEREARYRLIAGGEEAQPDCPYEQLYVRAMQLQADQGPKAVQEMLDKAYFERLLSIARNAGVPLCTAYVQAKVDFYNILSVLRLRRIVKAGGQPVDAQSVQARLDSLHIPGGSVAWEKIREMYRMPVEEMLLLLDGTAYRRYLLEGVSAFDYSQELSLLEKRMDDYITGIMREKRHTALGPEALLGYLHGRRIELMNVRLILTSILLGVPKHTVSERLRESYV